MKKLNEFIIESIIVESRVTKATIEKEIKNWIKNNISGKLNLGKLKFDTTTSPWTVNYDDFLNFKPNITSLNGDGLFQWGYVNHFGIKRCNKLKSLEGCPKEVESFSLENCDNISSLEGCPEKAYDFGCYFNPILTSLEGCPKEVKNFTWENNGKSFTKSEIRKVCNVKGTIDNISPFPFPEYDF